MDQRLGTKLALETTIFNVFLSVMRNYVVKLIVELTSDENTLRSKSVYINKLDQILVQILKKDWPKHWPTFIQEMVDSGLANTNLCENNMKILKYLR